MEKRIRDLQDSVRSLLTGRTIHMVIHQKIEEILSDTIAMQSLKSDIQRKHSWIENQIKNQSDQYRLAQGLIYDLQNKLQTSHQMINNLRVKHHQLQIELQYRAYNDDLRKLEQILQTMCPLSFAQTLQDKLKTTVQIETFQRLSSQFKEFKENVEQNFIRKEKALQDQKTLQNTFKNFFKAYSTKQEMNSISKKIFNQSLDLDHKLSGFTYRFNQKHSELQEFSLKLEQTLNEKVSLSEFTYLQEEIAKCAYQDYVDQLHQTEQNRYITLEKDIKKIKKQMVKDQQALIRTDQILLQKASKVELKQVNRKVNLISRHVDLQFTINDMVNNLQSLTKDYNTIQQSLTQVQSQTSQLMGFYSRKFKVETEFNFLQQFLNDLQTKLSYKSDRAEILNLLQQKAGVMDIRILNRGIQQIHKQNKLLAVQLGAMQRIIASPYKARGPERAQREYLSKITQKMIEFILHASPIEDTTMPEDLSALMELPDFMVENDFDELKPCTATPTEKYYFY